MDNEAGKYRMTHKFRGECVLINIRQTQAGPRSFTDVDAARIHMALSILKFKVTMHNDLTAKEIEEKLKEAAEKDHSNYDCFACIILSHGDYGVVEGKDRPIQVDHFLEYFKGHNCPSLAGKPKIFIFQACNPIVYRVMMSEQSDNTSEQVYKIPSEADFLMVWSLVPGKVPWREIKHGSCFIQALCKRLQELGKEKEINYILTRVLRDVSDELEREAPSMFDQTGKILPCVINMLTKELYFPPKQ